jgi:hypothetical protein
MDAAENKSFSYAIAKQDSREQQMHCHNISVNVAITSFTKKAWNP